MKEVAARHLFFFQSGGGEGGDHFGEQSMRAAAVVAAEVADIDVERDTADFRPGMDGQMRFGQHHGAGDAGRLARGVMEGMEEAADYRQPVADTGRDAE
jgi:hypothetical protein